VEVFKNCVIFSSGLPRRHLQIAAILARMAGLKESLTESVKARNLLQLTLFPAAIINNLF